jgi:DNA replication protein DnaC
LKKREEQKVTAQSIPSTTNFDEILEIGKRCQEKATERMAMIYAARLMMDEPAKPKEKIPEEPRAWRYIPKAYRDCRFETFNGNDKMVQGLIKLADTGCDIVLRGETGCGKTHLAVAIIQYSGSGHFTTAPELLLRIRATFGEGQMKETESEVIDDLCHHELLVLDDLGAEKTSEYAITTLYIIIDRRIRDAKRTIITTNLSLKEIEEKLDARIASRLSGMQNIKISMPDYRKKR